MRRKLNRKTLTNKVAMKEKTFLELEREFNKHARKAKKAGEICEEMKEMIRGGDIRW